MGTPAQLSQRPAGRPIASPQYPWRTIHHSLITSNTALVAANNYAHSIEWPASDITNGFKLSPAIDPCNQLLLKFYGSDANNETHDALIFGFSEWSDHEFQEYTGDLICQLLLTNGSKAINANSQILPATAKTNPTRGAHALTFWVDTIAVSVNEAFNGNISVYADAAEGAAIVAIDFAASCRFGVQFKTNTGAGCGGMYRVM